MKSILSLAFVVHDEFRTPSCNARGVEASLDELAAAIRLSPFVANHGVRVACLSFCTANRLGLDGPLDLSRKVL
jgi:hypothetical protein